MTATVLVDRHGTNGGWNDHHRVARDKPCDLCQAAHAGYVTAYRQRIKLRKNANELRHGTEQALIMHWAWDENPCALCQAWYRAYLLGLALEGLR